MPTVNWYEVLNAVTMAFPFFAWWKHRKRNVKNQRVLNLVKFHAPIAGVYHLFNSMSPRTAVTHVFKVLDLVFIHITSLASAKDIMGVNPPRKSPILYYASIPCHIISAALGSIYRDIPCIRFSLILCNNHPLLTIKKELAIPNMILGGSCYASFQISDKYPIGHSLFHTLLYPTYHGLFSIIEEKEHITFDEQSSSPTSDSLGPYSIAQ